VFLLTVGIASLIVFAMQIPKILDNNRRYKENQALQIEERTLFNTCNYPRTESHIAGDFAKN